MKVRKFILIFVLAIIFGGGFVDHVKAQQRNTKLNPEELELIISGFSWDKRVIENISETVNNIGLDNFSRAQQAKYYVYNEQIEKALAFGELAIEPALELMKCPENTEKQIQTQRAWECRMSGASVIQKIGVEKLTNRQQAVYYMYWNEPEKAASAGLNDTDIFIDALQAQDSKIRGIATETLKKMDISKLPLEQQVMYYVCTRNTKDLTILGDKAVPFLVKIINAPISENRISENILYNAIYSLGEMKSSQTADAIVNLINPQNDSSNNSAAMEALSKMGKKGIDHLLKLTDHRDYSISRMALEKIGQCKDPQIIETMLNWAEGTNQLKKSYAIEALRSIAIRNKLSDTQRSRFYLCINQPEKAVVDGKASVETIVEAIKSNDRESRVAAMWALAKSTDPAAVEHLYKLANDQDYQIQEMAVRALYENWPERLSKNMTLLIKIQLNQITDRDLKSQKDMFFPPLISILDDPNMAFKRAKSIIIFSLGDIGDPRAIDHISPYLEDEMCKRAAAISLKKLKYDGSKLDIKPKIEYLINSGQEEKIVEIGEPAIPYLFEIINSQNLNPAQMNTIKALEILGKIGNPKAFDQLIELLEREDATGYHQYIIEALGNIGDKRAIEPLTIEFSKSNKREELNKYMIALIKLDSHFIEEYIENILNTQHPNLSIVEAYSIAGTPKAIEKLKSLLNHPDDRISNSAYEKLAKQNLSDAVDLLVQMYSSTDDKMRIRAITYLINQNSAKAANLAMVALKDKNPDVVTKAISALYYIKPELIDKSSMALYCAVRGKIDLLKTMDQSVIDSLSKMEGYSNEQLLKQVKNALASLRAGTGSRSTNPGNQNPYKSTTVTTKNDIINQVKTLDDILPFLIDNNYEVRAAASAALDKFDQYEAAVKITEMLSKTDRRKRPYLCDNLIYIGNPSVKPLLAIFNKSDGVRKRAIVDILTAISNPESVNTLVSSLDKYHITINAQICQALSGMNQPSIQALNNLQTKSIWKPMALVWCGQAQYVDEVVNFIKNDKSDVELTVFLKGWLTSEVAKEKLNKIPRGKELHQAAMERAVSQDDINAVLAKNNLLSNEYVLAAMTTMSKMEKLDNNFQDVWFNVIDDNNKHTVAELVKLLDMYGNETNSRQYMQCTHKELVNAGKNWLNGHKDIVVE